MEHNTLNRTFTVVRVVDPSHLVVQGANGFYYDAFFEGGSLDPNKLARGLQFSASVTPKGEPDVRYDEVHHEDRALQRYRMENIRGLPRTSEGGGLVEKLVSLWRERIPKTDLKADTFYFGPSSVPFNYKYLK